MKISMKSEEPTISLAVVLIAHHHEAVLLHHMVLDPILNLTSIPPNPTLINLAMDLMGGVTHHMVEEMDILPEVALEEAPHQVAKGDDRIQHSSSNLSLSRVITLP